MNLSWVITVQFLVDIIIIELIILIMLFALVLIYSSIQRREKKNRAKWQNFIHEVLSELVIDGEIERKEELDVLLNNKSFRKLLIESIVRSKSKFAGIAFERIQQFVYDTNLIQDIWVDFEKKDVLAKGQAINALRALKITESTSRIEPHLSHPSPEVYLEAQHAIVSFKGFEGLFFLSELQESISDWQQIKLLGAIEHVPTEKLMMVRDWLQRPNDSVLIFCLRLIRKFQLFELKDEILTLFDYKNINVKMQVIKTLQIFEDPDLPPYLIGLFEDQNQEVQLQIMKYLKHSQDQSCQEFLCQQLTNHNAIDIRICSAEALIAIGKETVLLSISQDSNAEEDLQTIVKHVLKVKL